MQLMGGLKLALGAAARHDRRRRFAQVLLIGHPSRAEIALVTDADGRLRYRLPDGEYRLRPAGGEETLFRVADGRWTTVRLPLP